VAKLAHALRPLLIADDVLGRRFLPGRADVQVSHFGVAHLSGRQSERPSPEASSVGSRAESRENSSSKRGFSACAIAFHSRSLLQPRPSRTIQDEERGGVGVVQGRGGDDYQR